MLNLIRTLHCYTEPMLRDKMFWFGLDCRYHSNIKACEIKLNAFENLERAMEYIVNFLCFVLVIVPQVPNVFISILIFT